MQEKHGYLYIRKIDMGISVAEYFAQKEACQDCLDHGNEDHCVTTLLSRAENCFFYNAVHMGAGEYTEEQREAAKTFRDHLPEDVMVDYYVRCDALITKMDLFSKPFYEQYAIINRINYLFIADIIKEIMNKNTDAVISKVENMLTFLEAQNNIKESK